MPDIQRLGSMQPLFSFSLLPCTPDGGYAGCSVPSAFSRRLLLCAPNSKMTVYR
jgi:hypothetical protein